jgi:hypothetical protein
MCGARPVAGAGLATRALRNPDLVLLEGDRSESSRAASEAHMNNCVNDASASDNLEEGAYGITCRTETGQATVTVRGDRERLLRVDAGGRGGLMAFVSALCSAPRAPSASARPKQPSSSVRTVTVDCMVSMSEALELKCRRTPRTADQFTFVYDAYIRGGGEVKFSHKITRQSSVAELFALAARDYKQIDATPGLELHYLEDLSFEGIEIDHDAKSVRFEIGS